mmetsp:Transcript_39330/g.100468  ORF Transcript_39330/g.100468 Transcript_39330/m.100468 type:complete len:347 (+) Transcript_39330:2217-3257(+)
MGYVTGTIVADSNHATAGSISDSSLPSGSRMRKLRNLPYVTSPSGDVSSALSMAMAFSSVAGRPAFSSVFLTPRSCTCPSGASSSVVNALSMCASRSSTSDLKSSQPKEDSHQRLRRTRFMRSVAYLSGRLRRRSAALTSASVTRPSPSRSSSSKKRRPSALVYRKKSCTVMRRLLLGVAPVGVTATHSGSCGRRSPPRSGPARPMASISPRTPSPSDRLAKTPSAPAPRRRTASSGSSAKQPVGLLAPPASCMLTVCCKLATVCCKLATPTAMPLPIAVVLAVTRRSQAGGWGADEDAIARSSAHRRAAAPPAEQPSASAGEASQAPRGRASRGIVRQRGGRRGR